MSVLNRVYLRDPHLLHAMPQYRCAHRTTVRVAHLITFECDTTASRKAKNTNRLSSMIDYRPTKSTNTRECSGKTTLVCKRILRSRNPRVSSKASLRRKDSVGARGTPAQCRTTASPPASCRRAPSPRGACSSGSASLRVTQHFGQPLHPTALSATSLGGLWDSFGLLRRLEIYTQDTRRSNFNRADPWY